MSRLTRDGTAEPVSRDQILRHARRQGNIHFPCSADHEQDWQPYRLIHTLLYVMAIRTYIHTQEEGHTRFLIRLLSAVLALIFLAITIQPFLSLVDREVEFCVLTNKSFSTCWAFLFFIYCYFYHRLYLIDVVQSVNRSPSKYLYGSDYFTVLSAKKGQRIKHLSIRRDSDYIVMMI